MMGGESECEVSISIIVSSWFLTMKRSAIVKYVSGPASPERNYKELCC